MFDYNEMIKRAVKFFPTWSDIRKRYKTSNGGKLLGTVAEEVINLEDALKEYRKYYFLDTYEGHEDEVVAFSYTAKVGLLKDLLNVKVNYNNNSLEVTDNINNFLSDLKYAYYEEGNIYIREEIHTNDTIKISIDEYEKEYVLEKKHVWNIFDEFACFVNLERHKDETNKQLVDRILYSTKNKGNSSFDGLRNAIVSELLTDFPELANPEIAEQDISFNVTDDSNLRKAYKDFNSLLDFLNSMNRDVYRWKRWDLDDWQYDFRSISYIPAKWDEALIKWQNGIGYEDDLQVSVASNIQETNANITLYKKEKETMNKYLSNKKIKKDISFKFKKYNDILDSTNINYTIKASPMVRLYPEDITLDVYEDTNSVENVLIEDIYKYGKNVAIESGSDKINDIYPYRLKFVSKDRNKNIKINKCILHYINNNTGEIEDSLNLLTEKNNFILNALGVLTSNNIKQTINKVEDFYIVNGIKNNDDGGMICTQPYSYGTKYLYNLGGRKVNYDITCDTYQITQASELIKINRANCMWSQNDIIFNPDSQNKNLEIKIEANKFTFDVLTNNQVNVMVKYSEDAPYTSISHASFKETWSTEETTEPRMMYIMISVPQGTKEAVKVGNFRYSNYSIKLSYKNANDNFVQLTDNTLPMSNLIQLRVEINSNPGMYPVIKSMSIGDVLANSTYVTNSFEHRNNCYRKLDIECNCGIVLVKRNLNDTKDDSYLEDYDPSISYKAIENVAYIRLNLDDYSFVNEIVTDVGRIEKIEESGKIYYNLLLEKNQTIKRISIDGIKNSATYSITLLDLVNRELAQRDNPSASIPRFDITRDRLYCSKLLNGVILLQNDDEATMSTLKLNSKLLYGANVVKYRFSNLPSDLQVKWGVGDGVYSNEVNNAFDYISFFPASSRIHVANNSYELLSSEMKGVSVVENFSDPAYYNPKALNYYVVESNTPNVLIKFYNYLDVNLSFEELDTYCMGLKDLYIKNLNDLSNETIYSTNIIDYTDNYTLSEYIDLKDSYRISSNNTIYTEQYIVIPPKGMSVIYKEYDGTSKTKDLIKTEMITVDDKGFKKMQFSNIDKILYIGTSPYETNATSNFTQYNLLNEQGILIWTDELTAGSNIYIKYTIKKPIALSFDLEALYKLTGYTVETYKELSTYKLMGLKNGETYNLSSFKDFDNSDLAYIECSEPSFEGQMINNHTVKFNKHIEEKTIIVKTGYYYINGKEYYLFSENNEKVLNKNSHLVYENIDVSDDNIYTYKATNNFVRNSEMNLQGISELYSYDCSKTDTNNKFNKYTACESYNGWKTFNTTLELTDYYSNLRKESNGEKYEGFNDICLRFTPKDFDVINYAYVDITNLVSSRNYISLAATKNLKIFIGEEVKFDVSNARHPMCINPIKQIFGDKEDSCIRTDIFDTKEGMKYYLIVQGDGAIDDIIISDSLDKTVNYHVKNLDKFGFVFNESKSQGMKYRMELNDNVNCISDGASVCSDGKIKMTSNIDWNITSIKRYNTQEDFSNPKCEKDIELIVGDYIKTPKKSTGRFTTEYIQIDPRVINRLFFKINDVLLNKMDNVRVSILTSDNVRFSDVEILNINNNYGYVHGRDLLKYVKLKLELPEDCTVTDIELLAEYKSNKENAPIPITPNVGTLISPVYDSQESLNYILKTINIDDISNINDVEVYIRTMTSNNTAGIWNDWEMISLKEENGKIVCDNKARYLFENYKVRYFQIKFKLISKSAYIGFNSLEVEVKK